MTSGRSRSRSQYQSSTADVTVCRDLVGLSWGLRCGQGAHLAVPLTVGHPQRQSTVWGGTGRWPRFDASRTAGTDATPGRRSDRRWECRRSRREGEATCDRSATTQSVTRSSSASALPWIEQGPGVFFKPLRLSPTTGTWANLLRVERAGRVSRHRHLGAVQAWVLSGTWRYLEHDWVARPGDYVFEGPGEVHTLVVEAGEEMETLFVIDAAYEYLDDDGNVTGIESAASKLALYRSHCERNGLAVADIVY